MAAEYEHDWEDPRLAVEGFVTDYIVWRLSKDDLEWKEAPDVLEGAEIEHNAMRTMCEIFENRNEEEFRKMNKELVPGALHFESYYEAVKEFCTSDTDIPNEMTYGRMVGLISFAGAMCVEKAREGNRRDMGLIALYTSKLIDAGVRTTWIESTRSWAGLMRMHGQVIARRARPPVPPPPATPPPPRRSSLLFLAAGVSIVGMGAFITHRMLKSH